MRCRTARNCIRPSIRITTNKHFAVRLCSGGKPRLGLDNFAFIIHPLDPKRDVQRKFPLLGKLLPTPAINFFSRFFPPVYISHITGIRSAATGNEVEGWFVACPFTPQRMMSLPPQTVYRKIIATAHYAQRLGARLVGLGAYTSVVGDGGVTISRNVTCPVTTGDSLTVAVAVDAIWQAAHRMEIDVPSATAAVVGATGSIGAVSAELLARRAKKLVLIGRSADRLAQVQAKCEAAGARTFITSDLGALREAAGKGQAAPFIELLVTTAVLFLLYVGCVLVRGLSDDPERGRSLAAVVGVVGFLDVPIVHYSVVWFRTLHQPPSIGPGGRCRSGKGAAPSRARTRH